MADISAMQSELEPAKSAKKAASKIKSTTMESNDKSEPQSTAKVTNTVRSMSRVSMGEVLVTATAATSRTGRDSSFRTSSFESMTSSGGDRLTEDDRSEEEYEPAEDDHGYEKVRETYHKIQDLLARTEQDGVYLNPIREEFSMLWEGIEASHDNEVRLIQIDRETSAELSAVMAKSRLLIKLAEDDPELAFMLGQKLERAWTTVEVGEVEERENEEKIDILKQEIFELNRNINVAARVEGQDSMKELQAIKENLEKDRDQMNTTANKLRSALNVLFARRQEYFERRTSLEEKSQLLDEEFIAQNEAILRETGRKERIVDEIEQIRQKIQSKEEEIEDLGSSVQTVSAKLLETEKAVYDQRLVNEAAIREAEFASNRIEKLRSDFDHQQRVVERMTLDAYRRAQELRIKEEEVNNLKLELHRATRQRSLNVKKVVNLQQALATLENERENLKNKIASLEKDLDGAQKKLEENKRRVEELDKERGFVNRNLKRATAVTSEHANQAKTHEVAVRNLETAVKTYAVEINEQRRAIYRLERERDFYSHEATKMAQQVAFNLNEIKKLDMAIFQYRKKLGTLETQVKKTQQIYDIAVYDKGVFERTLRDTLTEILENNTKIRHLNNQVHNLRYQVNEQDEVIHLEALRYDRILKETDFFSLKARRIQRQAEDIQRQVEALESERSTLGCSIAEVEGELAKEFYYANSAASRFGMYERKLMVKEVELRNIWDKWRALHSTIRIGAYHYRNMMREIREKRYRIMENKKEQAFRLTTIGNFSRLRHEVAILENCLSKEKCMLNALREQMQHPMNIHRWRLLEATSPEAYELVLRINLLTKRLVERNNVLREQKRQLEEKEAMYVETKACLDRSPGLETVEEVKYFELLLEAKHQQLESLKKELLEAESQTEYYRNQVRNMDERMLSLKQQYFDKLRRKERHIYRDNITNMAANRRVWTAA